MNINREVTSNVVKVLVGNKIDLANRCVTTEEGLEKAQNNGCLFFETSARSNINV